MEPEEEKAYSQLMQILTKKFDYSATDFHEIYIDVETIKSLLAFLIDPKTKLEQAYRQKVIEFIDQGKSHSESETRAKAAEEYRKYRKLESSMNLGEELIRIRKKFKDTLEREFNRN